MLLNNNPRCPHLQTNRLNEGGASFLLALQKGSSQHPVCGEHQVGLLGLRRGCCGLSAKSLTRLSEFGLELTRKIAAVLYKIGFCV